MADKRAFDPIGGRLTPPPGDDEVCVSIPRALIPHILGALEPLRWPDLWAGDSGEINRVTGLVENLLGRLVSRTWCGNSDCPDCADCGEIPPPLPAMGGAIILEGDDMGQVVTDVQVVNGKIRVFFGPCCWHDLEGVSASELIDELGDDVPGALLPEGQVYSACGKATHLLDTVYRIVAGFLDASNEFPTQWVGTVEGYVPGYNLSNTHIANGVIEAAKLKLLFAEAAVTSAQVRHSVLCELGQALKPTAALSDDEWGTLKNAWFKHLGVLDLIFVTALAALGRGNATNIAKLGAIDVEAICPCEAYIDPGETSPDAAGWYLSQNYADTFTQWSETNTTWNTAINTVLPVHDSYGSFLIVQSAPDIGTCKRMSMSELLTAEAPNPSWDWTVWGNTSDQLQNINQNFPVISRLNQTIRESLAAQRGYSGHIDGGTVGIDSANPALPEGLGGQVHAARLHFPNTVTYGVGFRVIEFRLVHNLNSPSHP